MFPWWPKTIPVDWIPVFRTLGRKAIYGPLTTRNDLLPCMSNVVRSLSFGERRSLKENQLLRRCPAEVVYVLGKVLADGVKYFEIPSGFEALNEIEIPLTVKDYSQPFPAVVVKSGQEYHLVVHDAPSLMVGTFSRTKVVGDLEWTSMFGADRTIESYLAETTIITGVAGTGLQAVVKEPGAFTHHRWRATLNFLLLSMFEGIVEEPKPRLSNRSKRDPLVRMTTPRCYVPQNIELLKTRYAAAVRPEEQSEPSGSMKRPHWRRAHWRNVPVGKGRKERRLTFIRACFIHKEQLGSVEGTHSTYKVEAHRAAELMSPPQQPEMGS